MSRLTPSTALAALSELKGNEFRELLRHGSLTVEIYRPKGVDRQQPHQHDEVYVVISGKGHFVNGATRRPFEAGEVLFVPAGIAHHFEDFREDFATWVFLYGPEGGEPEVL